MPQESSQTPRRRDQVLFLNPSAWRVHSPFPRPEDNEGSPGEQGVLTQSGDPEAERGRTHAYIPQPPKTQTSHTHPSPLESPPLTQCSTYTPSSNPSCPDPVAARGLPSPPCRLSEVRQSRKRAAGKAQVPMIPGRVGGHTPFELLNTSAGWGPLPRPPAVSDRGSVGRPQGASPHLPLQQAPSPWPALRPTPHPSWVLTAGTGPHLAHEAPRLLSGSGTLAPGLAGSDVTPAAGEEQAGTVGTQAQPKHSWGEGGARPRNVGVVDRRDSE